MADMTRSEQLLNAITTGEPSGCAAMTRREKFLAYLAGECDTPPSKAFTREEKLLAKICENGPGGGDAEPGRPYIDTSKMTYFGYFFNKNVNFTEEDLKNIDVSNGTDFSNMFYRTSGRFTTIPPLNTAKGTTFDYMFYSCGAKEIQSLNLSRATAAASMFNSCSQLETINIVGTTNGINSSLALEFPSATKLTNITIPQGWKNSLYLHYSSVITVESLHGMIENLADLTGQTAKTFQIGATNIAKLDEGHLTMLESKNWNYA